MVFKSTNYHSLNPRKDSYTSFYLGITDETTSLLLTEGIEFKHRLTNDHKSQNFNYYFMENKNNEKQNIQISLSLYFGHVVIKIYIEKQFYIMQYLKDESNLIVIKNNELNKNCKNKLSCNIDIEILNDDSYISFSNFLISIKSEINTPIILKPSIVNKRTILSGEEQHFIVDLKSEKFWEKITSFFFNGHGELYSRSLLRIEMFEKNENYIFLIRIFMSMFQIIKIMILIL